MQTHHSNLPFLYNSQEKHFLKGILGRKSYCSMIKGKFRTLLITTDGSFEQKKSTAKSRYLFLQIASA